MASTFNWPWFLGGVGFLRNEKRTTSLDQTIFSHRLGTSWRRPHRFSAVLVAAHVQWTVLARSMSASGVRELHASGRRVGTKAEACSIAVRNSQKVHSKIHKFSLKGSLDFHSKM